MLELRFSSGGLSRERMRPWRKLARQLPKTLTTTATIGTVLVAAGTIDTVRPPKHVAPTVPPIVARHVLVIVDGSGSMEGTAGRVDSLMALLRRSGMQTTHRSAAGFGFTTPGRDNDVVHRMQAVLRDDATVDGVYIFSDFDRQSDLDETDAEGYRRLSRLLSRHRVRLYLGSVRCDPPDSLVRTARRSRGNLLRSGPEDC